MKQTKPPLQVIQGELGATAEEASPPSAVDLSGRFVLDDRGVFLLKPSREREGALERRFVCAPLHVIARVRAADSSSWGWAVRWRDGDGKEHTTIIEAASTVGDAGECVRPLLSGGLDVAPRMASEVVAYVSTSNVNDRARLVSMPGWQDDEAIYVGSDGRTYGDPGAEPSLYVPTIGATKGHGQRGTLESWQANVASLCIGNSRYAFAVAAAFAAPLLRSAHVDGGGFHFVGQSSTGKTRLLWTAQSVFGPRAGMFAWESTRHALGEIASMQNDAPLCIDEIGQVHARDLGEMLYLMSNGQGKAQGRAEGGIRERRSWRTLILSTGEVDIETAIRAGGKEVHAGQDARLASVPSDAKQGFGTFDVLHGHADGAALARALDIATTEHHGHAWPAWLAFLAAREPGERRTLVRERCEAWKQQEVAKLRGPIAGEVHRVLDRFSVVAVAGELATEAGVTGWPGGEASRAAALCFSAWLERRGGVSASDRRRMLKNARHVFESQWGLFELRAAKEPSESGEDSLAGITENLGRSRLGFRSTDGARAWVTPEIFAHTFAGSFAPTPAVAAEWFLEEGWLVRGDGRNVTAKITVEGVRQRAYAFDMRAVLSDGE